MQQRQPFLGRASAALAACLVAALTLSGCASREPASSKPAFEDPRPLVLATFSVIADIAANVAGDHLRVESLIPPGAEVHGYDPTPGDLKRAAGADLILDNGLGLEAWFEQFIDELDVPHAVVTQGVNAIAIEGDAYGGKPNPHAWMSPKNAEIYARNMAQAFAELDPAHASAYAENTEAYSREIQQLADTLQVGLNKVPQTHRLLVTCEGAFSYFARDAGLTESYIWPVNAERQATPRRIAAVIDAVRETQVPAVFCESTVSDASMQRVVESTAAVFGGVLFVDSLSEPDGPVPTYLDLLRHNTQVITAGLSGRST